MAPTCAYVAPLSHGAGSTSSVLAKCGAMLAKRSRTSPRVSYGSGAPTHSERALRIFQSSRAWPCGATAGIARCALPSVLTYVPYFSVYAAPGRTTLAFAAPSSPWCPWYTTNAFAGASKSSAASENTISGLAATSCADAAEVEGTKPRSSAATVPPASCRTLNPFHPAAGSTTPTSSHIL